MDLDDRPWTCDVSTGVYSYISNIFTGMGDLQLLVLIIFPTQVILVPERAILIIRSIIVTICTLLLLLLTPMYIIPMTILPLTHFSHVCVLSLTLTPLLTCISHDYSTYDSHLPRLLHYDSLFPQHYPYLRTVYIEVDICCKYPNLALLKYT